MPEEDASASAPASASVSIRPDTLDEFSLIDCLLSEQARASAIVHTGPGDDAAIVDPPIGMQLVTAVDTLVEGVHFLEGTPAELVAYRALAVNLSDLAAMGAQPGPCLLALTHPSLTAELALAFGRGFASCAAGTGAELVGGNLARGPYSLSVTVTGWVPRGTALLRTGAQPGDLVCVSGRIGLAARGLAELRDAPEALARLDASAEALHAMPSPWRRYLAPAPRLALGLRLRGRASACIDVSDGLLADLGHLLRASGVGARIDAECIPCEGESGVAIAAGDDYELLFTLPAGSESFIAEISADAAVPVSVIGRIVSGSELVLMDAGRPVPLPAASGWRHFT